MDRKEKQILYNFQEIVKKIPEEKKEYLLGFTEGMVVIKNLSENKETEKPKVS